MGKRLEEADFIKTVCIVLMVVFHLAYIGDLYPMVKKFVYTFHMPAFLMLSGYFLNVCKSNRDFVRSMWWLFVPYAVFESAYVVMASFLPTRDAVDQLSFPLVLDKLFLHPLGPYWYLHTLLLASVVSYVLCRMLRFRLSSFAVSILVAVVLGLLSYATGILSLPNVLYYAFGFALSQMQIPWSRFVRPSLWSLLPLLLLAFFPEGWDKTTVVGIAIIYFMMSLLQAIYMRLPLPLQQGSGIVGRNTLPILIFSPIFTMGAKVLLPYLSFDRSGMLFLVVATFLTLFGSLFLTWLMDGLHLSRYFWGKSRMLSV